MARPEMNSRPVTVYAAVAADVIVAVAKFAVAALTGSSAMLSEGIHSAADAGNQMLLLLGIHRAQKSPDEIHPFGYGKELYFWGLIVAMILFGFGGGLSVYEGIRHVQQPSEIGDPTWNYVVLGIAFVADGISWLVALRHLVKGRYKGESLWHALHRSKDPEIYIVLGEDSAALIGVAIAFLGVFLSEQLQMPILDGVASIGIGIVLILVSGYLSLESRSLLVGESADREIIKGIQAIARDDPAIARITRPLTMQFGPHDVLLTLDAQFERDLGGRELASAVDRLEKDIRSKYPEVKHIYIESELIKQQLEQSSSG